MTPEVKGLHHFTAIAGKPTENAKFYVNVLGMRMVKKTVNHDAPDVYHLFYGDGEGTPGSSITFFPGMTDREGKAGAGMVTELGLSISEGSIDYWKERLETEEIDFNEETWHEEETLVFNDPDGLKIRLVQRNDKFKSWDGSEVPEKHQIRGMSHITLSVNEKDDITPLIEELGMKSQEDGFYRMEDGSGVKVEETSSRGVMGTGSVHHVAFKAGEEEDVEKMREKLKSLGLRPSPAISRKYFTSTYARTSVGILFEFSSMGPGYTADESVEELGTSFVLPENLQGRREEILESLPEFKEEEIK
ncbi:MAG: VOC family protein [Nanohaloarchaea archaeon]|nr:VOC family protein [Candidatus Nanohaloarchaea archaeon]